MSIPERRVSNISTVRPRVASSRVDADKLKHTQSPYPNDKMDPLRTSTTSPKYKTTLEVKKVTGKHTERSVLAEKWRAAREFDDSDKRRAKKAPSAAHSRPATATKQETEASQG
jgi:hypothetical protein